MIYLTYNDQPSGIYFSQVTDVCNFLNREAGEKVQLVALISIRGFTENKRKIRARVPDAIVLPMVPKHRNWKQNLFLLRFVLMLHRGHDKIMCRGPFTAALALKLRDKGVISKVVFDGRGAYRAEFSEYLHKIVEISDDIAAIEKKAVMDSDFRLAVSQKLVDYWRTDYGYKDNQHVVIPCTLSGLPDIKELNVDALRAEEGYAPDDIIIVYSGSSAEWQSPDVVDSFLLQHLTDPRIKVILLSKFDLGTFKSFREHGVRISQRWVDPQKVHHVLAMADYGLLIRNNTVTNKVASPTKFAEYLAAGLKVIISPNVGDFPEFVAAHHAGVLYKPGNKVVLERMTPSEKARMSALAATYFTKSYYLSEYKKIVKV